MQENNWLKKLKITFYDPHTGNTSTGIPLEIKMVKPVPLLVMSIYSISWYKNVLGQEMVILQLMCQYTYICIYCIFAE